MGIPFATLLSVVFYLLRRHQLQRHIDAFKTVAENHLQRFYYLLLRFEASQKDSFVVVKS